MKHDETNDLHSLVSELKAFLIASAVTNIACFEVKTGLNVKTCAFDFTETESIGERKGKYLLTGVTVEVDLRI